MKGFHIHVPDVMLDEVTAAYCKESKNYSDLGFRNALLAFVNKARKQRTTDQTLIGCLEHFAQEKNLPTVEAIKKFFNRKDGKGVYVQDERHLLNLICYYAFGSSWYDSIDQRGFAETNLIANNEELDLSQPILTVFDTRTYSSKLNFKSRYIPLIGREEELRQLDLFWSDNRKFAWWIILGEGGTGKSKLALTFCEKLLHKGAHAGFIEEHNLRQFDWYKWLPKKDTLIVIDYVASCYPEVLQIIKTIQNRSYRYTVRLLLLERKNTGDWWDTFAAQIQLEYIQEWNTPLLLKGFNDENLLKILRQVYKNENRELTVEQNLIDKMSKVDDLNRPLFAILSSISMLEGEKIEDNTATSLIERHFSRESIIWEAFCARNGVSASVLQKHKNLIVLSTITRGIEKEKMELLISFRYIWVPSIDEFSIDLYHLLASDLHKSEYTFFGFIEPDILGEYFVLATLEKLQNAIIYGEEIVKAIMAIVWRGFHVLTFVFFERAINDFPKYRNALSLFFNVQYVKFKLEGYMHYISLLVSFLEMCGKNGDLDRMETTYRYFTTRLMVNGYDHAPIYQSQAAGLCCKHLIDQKQIELCEIYYQDLKQLSATTHFVEVVHHYIDTWMMIINAHERIYFDENKSIDLTRYYNDALAINIDVNSLISGVDSLMAGFDSNSPRYFDIYAWSNLEKMQRLIPARLDYIKSLSLAKLSGTDI